MDPDFQTSPECWGCRRPISTLSEPAGQRTEDLLGELVVSTRVLGSKEIMLLNHTGCGFTTFTDDELNAKLTALTGDASPASMRLFSFKDPVENTREQMKKVRSHPWTAEEESIMMTPRQ
jgi:carbonic anhydrase